MANYRSQLPQLKGGPFLTDGGIETTLIFNDGLDLPDFAAFYLLRTAEGRRALKRYFRTYAEIAKRYQTGFIFESPTWRANTDWGRKLGYSDTGLAEANRQAIDLVAAVRAEFGNGASPWVISGCVGPRGDGYVPTDAMSSEEARQYHSPQIKAFGETEADMVTAITMNYAEEAIGVALAAESVGMPVVISFTVETDGRLPTGQTLQDAISSVDRATDNGPAYYMINCAHPAHFADSLIAGEEWTARIRGFRANASMKSHAELNESETLDEGDPADLGRRHRALLEKLPHLNIFGGCCGTDHRHVEEIGNACFT